VALKATVVRCESLVEAAQEERAAVLSSAARERAQLMAVASAGEREVEAMRRALEGSMGKVGAGGEAQATRESALLEEVIRLRSWGLQQGEVGEEARERALGKWRDMLCGGGGGGGEREWRGAGSNPSTSSSPPPLLLHATLSECQALKASLGKLRASLDSTTAANARQLSSLARASSAGAESLQRFHELSAAESSAVGCVLTALATAASRSVSVSVSGRLGAEGTLNALRHRLLLLSSAVASGGPSSSRGDEAKLGLAAECSASAKEVGALSKALKDARAALEARETQSLKELGALQEKVEECTAAARKAVLITATATKVPVSAVSLDISGESDDEEEEG